MFLLIYGNEIFDFAGKTKITFLIIYNITAYTGKPTSCDIYTQY